MYTLSLLRLSTVPVAYRWLTDLSLDPNMFSGTPISLSNGYALAIPLISQGQKGLLNLELEVQAYMPHLR